MLAQQLTSLTYPCDYRDYGNMAKTIPLNSILSMLHYISSFGRSSNTKPPIGEGLSSVGDLGTGLCLFNKHEDIGVVLSRHIGVLKV